MTFLLTHVNAVFTKSPKLQDHPWRQRDIMCKRSTSRFGSSLGASIGCWLACACMRTALCAELSLPIQERFAAPRLNAAWSERVSIGTKLDLKDDGLHFNGPVHGLGHIERETGADLITIAARIAQWGSIYLVWSENNWCGVGQISPTPFGRLYSTAVKESEADEEDHRGIDFGRARWVRIQLGENFIRFLYSNDEMQWTELRTIPRPKAFAGAPKWLAAGKYYEAADRPFAVKNAASQALRESGDKIGGRVLEIKVESLPPSEAKLSSTEWKKLREPKIDPVTATLMQSGADPSYENIVKFFPPMNSPREVVGVPAHPLDIGVDRLGRFDVSPWSSAPVAWFELGDPPVALGKEGLPFKRRLLNGYLPIDTLTLSRDGTDIELTVFGWSDNFNVDKPLFAYARLTLRPSRGMPLPRRIALAAPGNKRQTWDLANQQQNNAHFCLRFKYPEPGTAEEITPEEFQAKAGEVAARWEKQLAPATRFEVPETRVMEAYRAWLTYSMLNADTVNGYIEPHDGAGFYEEMFGNSVSVHTMALDLYGLHDYAAQILDTQRHYQQTNGLYTQACGLTDPGGFLAGLARHYRMTADRAWLEKVRPNIVSQCNWLIAQRAQAPTSGVTCGLIKFRPYNDYQGAVFNYLGNVWCAQGMAETAAALESIGAPEAKRIALEAKKYRDDILQSMAEAAFKYQGQVLLPLEPDTRRLLKLEKYKGAGYYSLSTSPLLGTGFLPANDKRTTWCVDALEKRGGLVAGVCEFETGIDHAYTYGYLLNELKRGEVRKVLLGFYSMLAFGMTRDTYSPVEVTMIETGENHYTLPHLYSCTEQLRLLRAMLIRENGDELRLGEAIPRAWLEHGKKVSVMAAPTEFGEVTYQIQPQADGSMQIHLDPPHRQTPSKISLTLREPRGRRIVSVNAASGGSVQFSRETIVLPRPNAPVDLLVRFKEK